MATHAPTNYDAQREKLAEYFDRTARKAWIDLTSDTKVSGIRATVRAGRERMRDTLLSWLPEDLRRTRILDAGCGTGALSVAAACRGAEVTGVDVASGLVEIARERTPSFIGHGRIDWHAGDMLNPAFGEFDHIVLMDSLIHYLAGDIVSTLAPHTAALGAMHKIGKIFPRSDRSPAIIPVAESDLRQRLASISGWQIGRTQRISSGFYTSQAMELVKL